WSRSQATSKEEPDPTCPHSVKQNPFQQIQQNPHINRLNRTFMSTNPTEPRINRLPGVLRRIQNTRFPARVYPLEERGKREGDGPFDGFLAAIATATSFENTPRRLLATGPYTRSFFDTTSFSSSTGDATLGREPQPSLDMKTNHTQTSPDHRLNRVKPSPNLTTNHTQQTSTDHRMSHTRSNPILRPPLPLIPPSTQEDGSIELSKDAFRSRTSSQPRRRDTSSSGDPGPHPQGSDGDGGNVDNVLAALVGYSRDPELWRFVHSVVDELDYSRRARSKVPIRSRLPALHLSPSRGRRWRAAPGMSYPTIKTKVDSRQNSL
ncbi:hypothetical protein Hamer_G020854, partial [Homarus americanus]